MLHASPASSQAGATAASEAPITLKLQQASYETGLQLLYYEDKPNGSITMNARQIQALPAEAWQPVPDGVANFGFSESIFWFTLKLVNPTPQALALFAHVDYAMLDDIRLYHIQNKQLGEALQVGDQRPYAERLVDYPTFLFPLTSLPNSQSQLLLRVETKGALQVPLSLWQQDQFFLEKQSFLLIYGLFIGVLLVMSTYNLFLFASLRDWSYFFYSLFTLSIAGLFSSLDGFAYQWIWPNWTNWHQISPISFNALGVISLAFFTRFFLPFPKQGVLNFCSKALIFIAISCTIVSLTLPFKEASILQILNTIIVACGILLVSVGMLKHSPRIAGYYLLAWSAYVVGALLKASSKLGVLAYSPLFEYAGVFGAILGMVLLSLALADRINQERRAKITAQAESINTLQRYYSLYENAFEGIFVFDFKGNLLSANPAFLNMLGMEKFDPHSTDRIKPNGFSMARDDFMTLIAKVKKEGHVVNYESTLSNSEGEQRWVTISARLNHDPITNAEQMEGTLIDTSERKAFETQLKYLASHDPLTGFLNRRAFEAEMKDKLEHVKHHHMQCCLLYMDLDQFKDVNDLCGHTAGDALLSKLSQRLSKQAQELGGQQVIARLGGDEFCVLLPQTSLVRAQQIAEDFRQAVEEFLFLWEGNRYTLGVSIGLVELAPYHHNVEHLLVMADSACYMAKDLGRNRVHTFVESDGDLQFRQMEMQWVTTIKEALNHDHFFLVFQNIEANHNPKPQHHYEVLLRLISHQGNLCSPSQFLPAAERYNLMPSIDRWVINHFFSWLQAHPDHLDNLASASINLTTQSIGDEPFADFLFSAFEKYRIPPEKICFEITENMAITHLDNTHSFIKKFRHLGCSFALDDFGTGFSSYAYLKELAVDYLKIDGIFIRNIADDDIDFAMVQSICDVAKAIGIETIAEFVENEDIRQKLINIGVNYSQGYHIHKPVSLSESNAFLSHSGPS